MKYNGVITKKIEMIEDRILKLKGLQPLDTQKLQADYFLKSGVERTLQVCVEAVIDIAERIIALGKLSPVTSSYKAIERLEVMGIIKEANKYKNMIQFRNFVVHRYESVENEELVAICNNNLNDFIDFIGEIQNVR